MAAFAEESAEAPALSASSGGKMRVYIGGLGGGVQDSDMLKLFSPLGRVGCVDFVRTKGRAFAYIDFSPNSDKSLAKLFSTYNGCVWKGGKLKIEKAKEHYLNRLKREWAEDTEPLRKPEPADIPIDPSSSSRLMHETRDKEQLHVFFPKLRKVKALPIKGTGKHKYSFQRVMITSSSLPVHFCDCEEHSRLSEDLARERLTGVEERKPVVKKREINIMTSVMNKLLAKEVAKSTGIGYALSGEGVGEPNVEDQVFDDEKMAAVQDTNEEEEDDENLVMNFGTRISEQDFNMAPLKAQDGKMLSSGKPRFLRDHDKKEKKRNVENDHVLDAEESKHSSSKATQQEEKPREKDTSAAAQSQSSDLGTKPEVEESLETSLQTKGKSTWTQKSSWKELVGEATGNNPAFSISQILPWTVGSVSKPTLSEGAGFDTTAIKADTQVQISHAMKRVRPASAEGLRKSKKGRMSDGGGSHGGDVGVAGGGADPEPETKPEVPFSLGPVQSFVRSRESEKEWTKAKAALSGYLKRSKSAREGPSISGGQGQSGL
ncbi:RNA-binding (RRM/RBD/RNP motifs) family protein [Wolffia australiana]